MRNSFILFLILLFTDSCIDRLTFKIGDLDNGLFVVDGMISDQPGPYTVKLFRSRDVDEDLRFSEPLLAKEVIIASEDGEAESLKEVGVGEYQTDPNGIRGQVGKDYHVRIELYDGSVYESKPEKLKAGGTLDSLYYEFESYEPLEGPTQYGFRIFIDAHNVPGDDSFLRWQFNGAYKIETYPELHTVPCGESRCPDPRPCSGVIWYNQLYLKTVGTCTCCICWVNQLETKPQVRDNSLVVNGKFKKVEMAFVPVEAWTFYEKYLVELQQMSLTKEAYEFYKTIQEQKEGATSLFQPAIGKPRTNIFQVNGNGQTQGYFFASSISKKIKFLTGNDSPVSIPPPEVKIEESCLIAFPHSGTQPPGDWN